MLLLVLVLFIVILVDNMVRGLKLRWYGMIVGSGVFLFIMFISGLLMKGLVVMLVMFFIIIFMV